jgi:hypothetical protein
LGGQIQSRAYVSGILVYFGGLIEGLLKKVFRLFKKPRECCGEQGFGPLGRWAHQGAYVDTAMVIAVVTARTWAKDTAMGRSREQHIMRQTSPVTIKYRYI